MTATFSQLMTDAPLPQAGIPARDDPAWDGIRARLVAFARRRVPEGGVDGRGPEDLAQDAIAKTLSGERRRPAGVALMAFLCATVQSLASHAARRSRGREALGDPPLAGDGPFDLVSRAELLRGAWIRVRRSIEDDDDAQALLDVLIAHWPENDLPEIAERLGWTSERVRSVWRRIAYKVRSRAGGLES